MNKNKTHIWQEVYKAIAYFITRQQLVAQAMQDLGLDLDEVAQWGTAAWSSAGSEPRIYEGASDEEKEVFSIIMRARARNLSQVGFWGDNLEWEYFLHGKGCRLKNVNTKEFINWDCPNTLAFNPYFFLNHLEWQIESGYRADKLRLTQNWIQQHPKGLDSIIDLIGEMIDNGLINQDLTLPDIKF